MPRSLCSSRFRRDVIAVLSISLPTSNVEGVRVRTRTGVRACLTLAHVGPPGPARQCPSSHPSAHPERCSGWCLLRMHVVSSREAAAVPAVRAVRAVRAARRASHAVSGVRRRGVRPVLGDLGGSHIRPCDARAPAACHPLHYITPSPTRPAVGSTAFADRNGPSAPGLQPGLQAGGLATRTNVSLGELGRESVRLGELGRFHNWA